MSVPESWNELPLSEVVELQRGFDLPATERSPGPYPVVTSGETGGWHSEGLIQGPGVVIGRATNLGRPKWVASDYWPHNTTMFVKDFKGNHPRWVFHLFEVTDLTGYDSGSVQPMLNRNRIGSVRVSRPPVSTQRAIAGVLEALDDKIAANAEVLLATGRLVRATLTEASRHAHTGAVADIAALMVRGVAPRYVDGDSGVLVLNQKCVRGGRVAAALGRRTSAASRDKMLKPYDVLVNSTGMGTLGRAAVWTRDEEVTVDSHITIVRFDSDKVDAAFGAWSLAMREKAIEELGEGSTGQTELKRRDLASLTLPLPDRNVQRRVGGQLRALGQLCDAKEDENAKLAELRDTLLGPLMSGRLKIKDAERVVEEVV